eukprot:822990-Amphidinium_carterae.1
MTKATEPTCTRILLSMTCYVVHCSVGLMQHGASSFDDATEVSQMIQLVATSNSTVAFSGDCEPQAIKGSSQKLTVSDIQCHNVML